MKIDENPGKSFRDCAIAKNVVIVKAPHIMWYTTKINQEHFLLGT